MHPRLFYHKGINYQMISEGSSAYVKFIKITFVTDVSVACIYSHYKKDSLKSMFIMEISICAKMVVILKRDSISISFPRPPSPPTSVSLNLW